VEWQDVVLATDYDQCFNDCVELKQMAVDSVAACQVTLARNKALRAQLERARRWLIHDEDCQLHKKWHRHKGCDCGLTDFLKSLEDELELRTTKGGAMGSTDQEGLQDGVLRLRTGSQDELPHIAWSGSVPSVSPQPGDSGDAETSRHKGESDVLAATSPPVAGEGKP
jgi:hypothetical protein